MELIIPIIVVLVGFVLTILITHLNALQKAIKEIDEHNENEFE